MTCQGPWSCFDDERSDIHIPGDRCDVLRARGGGRKWTRVTRGDIGKRRTRARFSTCVRHSQPD